MDNFNHYQLILDELKGTLSHVKDEEFDGFVSEVTSCIFIAGKGVLDSLQTVLQ